MTAAERKFLNGLPAREQDVWEFNFDLAKTSGKSEADAEARAWDTIGVGPDVLANVNANYKVAKAER